MKRTVTHITLMALAIVVFLSACSVERRHYRPGLHLRTEAKVPKPEIRKHEVPVESIEQIQPLDVAPADMSSQVETPVSSKPEGSKSGDNKKVYADNKNLKQVAKPVTKAGDKFIATNIISKKALQGSSPKGMMADKIVSIILCIFLGWLGIHRFYLGYPVSAIIMIVLFVASVVLGGFVLGYLGYICGLLLFVWIVVDLVFLILDRPLFFPS